MKPTLSLIIRTHNSEKTIPTCLKSIFSQPPDHHTEIIVVDDHSVDATTNLVCQYCHRLRLINSTVRGPINNINFGINQTHGKWYMLIDADDLLLPNALYYLHHNFNQNRHIGIFFADYQEINTITGKVSHITLKQSIYNSLAAGIAIQTTLLLDIGGYDPSLVFPEYDVLAKLLKNTTSRYIPQEIYQYRRHPQSLTASHDLVSEGRKQLQTRYGNSFCFREY